MSYAVKQTQPINKLQAVEAVWGQKRPHYAVVRLMILTFCTARVTESQDTKYPVGSEWQGYFGWRTHTICNPSTHGHLVHLRPIPPLGDLPKSLALGAVGMPG